MIQFSYLTALRSMGTITDTALYSLRQSSWKNDSRRERSVPGRVRTRGTSQWRQQREAELPTQRVSRNWDSSNIADCKVGAHSQLLVIREPVHFVTTVLWRGAVVEIIMHGEFVGFMVAA
mmetsp:Transcript_10283/g.17249  ORF Transcript_10283/g.17249 Transcript_10283/m.17249 type:complete len:120 (-) Transcript_10283:2139-2498(-)